MSKQYDNIRMGVTRVQGTLKLSSKKLEWRSKMGNMHHTVKAEDIKEIVWLSVDSKNKMMKIQFKDKSKPHLRLVGFSGEDEYELDRKCRELLDVKLKPKEVSVKGGNWGQFVIRNNELTFRTENKELLCTIPFETLNQSVLQAKNEVSLEFNLETTKSVSKRPDQLMEMRIYIPNDDSEEKLEAYEAFHELLIKKAGLQQDKSQIIARFEQISFRVPRGKYDIQFFPSYFTFRGATFSYKIDFRQIKRLFIFRLPDTKMAFLISLNPPIRQGQTTYWYLIMECPENESSRVPINLSEKDLKEKYLSRGGHQLLQSVTQGPTYDVLSRVFMALSKVKVIQAKNFKSSKYSGNLSCIRCSLSAHTGLLYPLEKSLFFIFKPPTYIRHSEIDRVEFSRINESNQIKLFDFVIHHKSKEKKIMFTGIDKHEYEPLVQYVLSHPNIKLNDRSMHSNILNGSLNNNGRRKRKNYQYNDVDIPDDDDEDEDEDYDMDQDKHQLKQDEKDDKNYDRIASGPMQKLDGDYQDDDDDDDDNDQEMVDVN